MADAALSIRGLHVQYGASRALQGVDIAFDGGAHAVLGRNGMGKTTLCKAVMGLVPARAGSIRFNGVEIAGKSPHAIAKLGIGYVPQGRRLWHSLTVDEHLRLCADAGSPWTVDRVYDEFPRLAERRSNSGGRLSGGEQQMLAIARALLPGPRLLVMDEPTEGLAPVIVDQVVELLKNICEAGEVAVLLVEQNLAVATAVAVDVSIMVNGRISTVLPAADLAADRELQERLLGVGRHGRVAGTPDDGAGKWEGLPDAVDPVPERALGEWAADGFGGRKGSLESDLPAPPHEAKGRSTRGESVREKDRSMPMEPRAPKNDYIPPPRWSPEKWKARSAPERRASRVVGMTRRLRGSEPPAIGGDIIVAGTFDTKERELNFLRDRLLAQNLRVKTVDLSTSGKPSSADVPPHHVAAFHPGGPGAVMTGDRGTALAAMAEAFERWTKAARPPRGMISAAGSGGTALVTPAMRTLPIGVPKMMISTVASGDIGPYVGPSDIMMMYSVTDVQGINSISARVLTNGADALAGAARFGAANPPTVPSGKPALGLTMFGVTTPAVQSIAAGLEDRYECLVFHATGAGGRSMEKLADDGQLAGAIDVTTSEVCDLFLGGVMPATEDRFGAFIRSRIPYVGSAGALDIVNWRAPDTVPDKYKDRLFYEHNPEITLMRTTPEENDRMGVWIAERLNRMTGPTRFLLPLKGVSALDSPGGAFDDPEARDALFGAIHRTFEPAPNRRLIEIDSNINDPAFAEATLAAFAEITE